VSFAFKTNSRTRRQVLFEEGSAALGYNIYVDQGYIYFGVWDQSTGISQHRTFLNTPIPTTRTGWVAVTLVINAQRIVAPNLASTGFKVYVGGKLAAQGVTARLYRHDDFGFAVGGIRGTTRFHDTASTSATTFQLDGFVSELRIFNRPLSTSEITSLAAPFLDTAPGIGGESPASIDAGGSGSRNSTDNVVDEPPMEEDPVPLDNSDDAPDLPPQEDPIEEVYEPSEPEDNNPPTDTYGQVFSGSAKTSSSLLLVTMIMFMATCVLTL
jgi:hypothetical protein